MRNCSKSYKLNSYNHQATVVADSPFKSENAGLIRLVLTIISIFQPNKLLMTSKSITQDGLLSGL